MKRAIEILENEMRASQHFAKYPQDAHKDEKRDIKVLITTSEYHDNLAKELSDAVKILKSSNLAEGNSA